MSSQEDHFADVIPMTGGDFQLGMRFCNFETGQSELRPEHTKKIREEIVPRIRGTKHRIQLIGRASRRYSSSQNEEQRKRKNKELSNARCLAVELGILEHFLDAQFTTFEGQGSAEADLARTRISDDNGFDRAVEVLVFASPPPPPDDDVKPTGSKGFSIGIGNALLRLSVGTASLKIPLPSSVSKRLKQIVGSLDALPPFLRKQLEEKLENLPLEVPGASIAKWGGDFKVRDDEKRLEANFRFDGFALEAGGSNLGPFVGFAFLQNAGFARITSSSPIEITDFGGFGAELFFGIFSGPGGSSDKMNCHHFSQSRFEKNSHLTPVRFDVPFSTPIPILTDGIPVFAGVSGTLKLESVPRKF